MNLIQVIRNYLARQRKSGETPEGYCPNCWGRQEYEGKFLQALQQENIDLNNIDQKAGWIQAYATKNFEGIKLRDIEDVLECPSCKITYRLT